MTIPKLIHHSAPEDRSKWHPVWDKCLHSWYVHFPEPEYTHVMWDDDDIEDEIRDNHPSFYEEFSNFPYHIQKLDFWRHAILFTFGGIYADMDVFCFQNFYDDLRHNISFCGSAVEDEDFSNCLMVAEPGQKLMIGIMRSQIDNVKNTEIINTDSYVLNTTGPNALTKMARNSKRAFKDVHVLPATQFNPDLSTIYDNGYVKTAHLLTGLWGKDIIDHNTREADGKGITIREHLENSYKSWRGVDYQRL